MMMGTDGLARREIKFRAWLGSIKKMERFTLEEMMYGDSIDTPDVIMQYTGLKDKNGVEIYEGDILYYREPFLGGDNVGKVYFSNGCYFVGKFHKALIYIIGGGVEKTVSGRDTRTAVIGNIFENPELLETNNPIT